MKKKKGNKLMLKKILAIAFVISLLSNHMMILGEFANVALASEVEWQSEFTSSVEKDANIQEEKIEETEEKSSSGSSLDALVTDNASGEVSNKVDQEQAVDSEKNTEDQNQEEQSSQEESAKEPEENSVDLEVEKTEEKPVLSEEEIQALQEITANTELEIKKLIKYDNENGKGTLVDLSFKFNVDTKDHEVDSIDIDFNLPDISGILPNAYKIEEMSEGLNLAQDEETGRMYLTLNEVVSNYEQELRLVLVYSADTFAGTAVNINGGFKVNVKGYQVVGEFSESKEAVETKDPLATYGLTTDSASRYKGYLYANNLIANKKDFAYNTTSIVEVKEANFIDEIIVENNIDKFITDSKEIELINKVAYKSSAVNVEEFEAVLGSSGYIEIYNVLGEKLGEITSSSEVVNNRYTFYYTSDVDRVIFRIKNVESNGTLNIKNEKVLKGTDDFSREYIKSFKSLKSGTTNKIAKFVNENEVIVQNVYSETNINLEETESKMTLEMNTKDFVTTETNEVTFSLTLKTNEERYDLFKNPTISIELPSAVQNVEIKNVSLMYKNGLSLSSWNVVQNEVGTNTIQVALEGTQSEYTPGTLIEGTTIVVTANLDLNKITANGTSKVKLRYTNEAGNVTSYAVAGKDSEDTEVNYVSRSGILKESKLENFNDANDVLVTYEDEAVVGTIEANNTSKTAKVSTVVMNNYDNEIGKVEILGKIPYVGNTKDGVDLNTTFDTTLNGPVTLNGLVGKVYYSTEENPSKDSDSWQENVADMSQVKSFKVVVDNETMKIGEKVEVSYNLNIPENVGYNASAYNLFTTFYNLNNQEVTDSSILGLQSEIKEIDMDDCQVVQETPELTIGTQVTRGGNAVDENDEINEGQILRYNVVLTNKTAQPITNINLKANAENANSYYWYTYTGLSSTTNEDTLKGKWIEDTEGKHLYETETIENLAPGETKVFTYQVKVKELKFVSGDEVFGKILVSADGIQEQEYQTIKNKVRDAKIHLEITAAGEEDATDENMYLASTNLYNFITKIENISNEDLENVKVNVMVPDELELSYFEMGLYNEEVEFSVQNTSSGEMVTFIIPRLEKGTSKEVVVAGVISSLDYSIYESEMTIKANSSIDGQLYLSNDYTRKILQTESFLNVEYTSTPENGAIVKNNDIVQYKINITNIGVINYDLDLTDYFDNGLVIDKANITYPDGTQKELEVNVNNYILEMYNIEAGKSVVIDILAHIDSSRYRTNQTTIENELDFFSDKNISEFENIVFQIDPNEVMQMPDDGKLEDDDKNDDITNIPDDEQYPEDKEENKNDQNQEENNNNNNDVNTDDEKTNNNDEANNGNNSTQEENNNQTNNNKDNNKNNNINDNASNNVDINNSETNNVKEVRYSISGKTWLDINRNNLQDDDVIPENISVILLKASDKDSSYINDNNIVEETKVNEKGEYIFDNLEKGNYIVVFDYDNNRYEVSTYQAEKGSKSSGVVLKKLTLNNNNKNYAVSDLVQISEHNVNNINMGLRESSDFDMAINTYVKNITIVNEKGTEKQEFTPDDRIAKIEIASKYLNSSRITVEYGIQVVNNGKTSGYVNQISDYIPEGFEFDSNSSNNWQLGEDGVLYSSSFNKALLKPGEAKEISLIFTKDMTGNSTGVYKNTVRIIDSTNDIKLSDSNQDNDSSEVELMVSVKTGAVYYVLVIVIALTIAFVAMLIVSKLLKDDKTRVNLINKIIIIVSLIIIVVLCIIIKVYAADTPDLYYDTLMPDAGYSGTDAGVRYPNSGFISFNDFYNKSLNVNIYTGFRQGGYFLHRVVQCVEGNITTTEGGENGKTRLISDVWVPSGRSYGVNYWNGSAAVHSSGNNSTAAARFAYISAALEKGSYGLDQQNSVMRWVLNRTDAKAELSELVKVHIQGTADKTKHDYTKLWTDAGTYASNIASGGTGVNDSANGSKLSYNANLDAFGAINASYPTNAKMYIALDGVNYSEYKGNVLLANGTPKKFNECSNQAFYIPFNEVSSASDLEKVKIKLEATVSGKKARILICFSNKITSGSGQNRAIMRGADATATTSSNHTLDAIANVEVEKVVKQKALSNGTSKENISEGAYVDRADRVYYDITVTNKGMAATFDLHDTYDTNQYDFVAIYENGQDLKVSDPKGNWVKSITLSRDQKKVYTVVLKVKENVTANEGTQLKNNTKIDNFKINNKPIINNPNNRTEDSSYVKCKQYKISIDKSIDSITSINGAPASTQNTVEVGDIIKYKIVVQNNGGTASSAYGTTNYTINETVPEGFRVTEASGWTQNGNNFTISGSLDSGATKTYYVSMEVTNADLSKEAIQRTNVVTLTTVTNRNNIELINNYLVESKLESSITVKILGYNISVSKKVQSVNGGAVTDLTKCEVGDTIVYKIEVKNTGTSAADFGNMKKLKLVDTFDPGQLQFINANGDGWTRSDANNYSYDGIIKPGETITLTIEMKVILQSTTKSDISNTAKVESVVNKNNVILTHIVPIESTSTVEYQIYELDVWKYVSEHNSKAVTGREQMKNLEKFNSPVEVEKYDTLTYTIVVKNAGTTILHNATFQDTLETGLTYKETVSMKKFKDNGSEDQTSNTIKETVNGSTITYNYPGELLGGEYIVVKIKAEITMTNMYLLNLKNEIKLTSIFNRNEIDLVPINLVVYPNNENDEYVRLKNLVVSGNVWVDENRDGKMDENEPKLSGIEVILHDDTNKKVASTVTDADGKYTFSETNGKNSNGSDSDKKMVEGGDNSGRVIKGTNRDEATGNYNENSRLINYYVEFYYNGVKYISTVYAGTDGMKNIVPSDKSIKVDYMTDSNAFEYKDIRDAFNQSLETIEYNTAINGIVETPNGNNTKELKYKKDGHVSTIDLTEGTGMSAYSFMMQGQNHAGTLTNGKNINMLFLSDQGETEYLKYINLGLQTRDFDVTLEQDSYDVQTTVNGIEMKYELNQGDKPNTAYGGDYVTGGEINPVNYQFKLYASDYHYKHTQYENQDVIDYKVNTELNTEITYKITVTNNNVEDKNGVYTRIREIVDFYSSDFKAYDPNNNTKVVKVKGDDGYLHDETINIVEAWYEYIDRNNQKQTGSVTLSNTPKYPEHANVNLEKNSKGEDKYRPLYLSGFDNLALTEGEKFDIYIKFVVDTEDGTNDTNLLLEEKNNIAEINAYSTYYQGEKPAGYIDINSNPGSIGVETSSSTSTGVEGASIEKYSEYENDSYKTGVTLSILNGGNEENPPSGGDGNTINPPGGGDNITTPPEGTNPNPDVGIGALERVIKGSVWDDARNATTGEGGDTQYRGNGIKNIGADNKIKEAASNSKQDKKGKLIVDESTDQPAEGINVKLIEVITVPKNGEDRIYEETLTTWGDSVVNTRTAEDGSYTLSSFIPGNYIVRFNYGESVEDVIYNGQEYKSTTYYNIDDKITTQPDSGDKVLVALEENSKSDARDDEIRRLEVIRYSETVNNFKTEEAQKSTPNEYSENFMKNTSMNANTEIFPVRTEKVPYDKKEYTFEEYMASINKDLRYKIENIDFGVEYRPEVDVNIEEFISEIKLTTSDGSTLVDIKFDNVYEEVNGVKTNKIIGTTLNTETSIGDENLQYLPTVEDVKGLAYLNIDEDLLQGCTVDVTYVFNVNNNSEVDRISKTLYNLRYKADAIGFEAYYDDVYTAAGTARNELYEDYFKTDAATYRTQPKKTFDGTNGYYGKYLGEAYYSGKVGSKDIVAELKVDKILDYVDNDMTMQTNKNESENRFWRPMTNEELLDQGLLSEGIFAIIEETIKGGSEPQIKTTKQVLDDVDIAYDVDTRHNLVVSVDDKVSSSDNNNLNKTLSLFLTPDVSNTAKSSGSAYLVASKVVAGESDTENMVYDNSAEIIQYTSVTGRVTRLSTTVGNLNMNSNPEYEPDSDFTERVTLTPPTGLEKAKYYMSIVKDQIIMITTIIAIIIVAIVLKKSLKNVTFKKFYK